MRTLSLPCREPQNEATARVAKVGGTFRVGRRCERETETFCVRQLILKGVVATTSEPGPGPLPKMPHVDLGSTIINIACDNSDGPNPTL